MHNTTGGGGGANGATPGQRKRKGRNRPYEALEREALAAEYQVGEITAKLPRKAARNPSANGHATGGSAGGRAGDAGDSAGGSRPGQNGHKPSVIDTARKFNSLGLDYLVYDTRTKNPNRDGWQNEPCPTIEAVERAVAGGPKNIGMQVRRHRVGRKSVGLQPVDVDLDTIEAVRIAPRHLPPTGLMWGRDRKPRSHYIYLLPEGERLKSGRCSFEDPSPPVVFTGKPNAHLLELRQSGQTVAPGSRHEDTGEQLRFELDGDGAPSIAAAETLMLAGERIRGPALVARFWHEGKRNNFAVPLAGFLWHGGLNEQDALSFMEDVCLGACDDETEKRLETVRATYRRGAAGENVSGGRTLIEEEYLTEQQVRTLRKWLKLKVEKYVGILGPDGLPLAGDGDGERFAAMWVGQVLYCADVDAWFIYDGARWVVDGDKEIRERAKAVVAEFRRVLGADSGKCGQNNIASYAECADYSKTMGNAGAISAMLVSAQSKPELRIRLAEFDADPLLFNAADGTLELDVTTGHVGFHLHRASDRLTMLSPAHFYPDATHPLYTQAMTRFYPEAEREEALEEMAGYALTGLPKRHSAELIGPHDAGKSTTLKLFGNTWGDYAASLAATNLTKNPHKGGDVGRPDLWRIRRKRLVTVSEFGPDDRLDVALYKTLTSGGDKLALRTFFDKTGGEDVVFAFSLWMSGNKPFGPPPDEDAAFARLIVLDCSHVVPEGKRDAAEEYATTNDPAVWDAALAAAVRGFKRLYGEKKGVLAGPASSQRAKEKLQNDLDPWANTLDSLFDFTSLESEPTDGVLWAEAWDEAKAQRQRVDERWKSSRRERDAFEAAMRRRLATGPHRSSARFENNVAWFHVRWQPDVGSLMLNTPARPERWADVQGKRNKQQHG